MKILSFLVVAAPMTDDGDSMISVDVPEGATCHPTFIPHGGDIKTPVLRLVQNGEATLYPMARIVSIEVDESDEQNPRRGRARMISKGVQ